MILYYFPIANNKAIMTSVKIVTDVLYAYCTVALFTGLKPVYLISSNSTKALATIQMAFHWRADCGPLS